jgi:hypothetical protein
VPPKGDDATTRTPTMTMTTTTTGGDDRRADGGENGAVNSSTGSTAGGAQKRRSQAQRRAAQAAPRGAQAVGACVSRAETQSRSYYETDELWICRCRLSCTSCVSQLGKTSNELLWLAIVGLTDQHVHERVNGRRLHRRRLRVYADEVLGVQRPGRRRRRRRGAGAYDDSALRAAAPHRAPGRV